VLATREPGGAPGAEQIRSLLVRGEAARWDPVSETLLHFAARREHLEKTVRPALAAGRWVISDRFADSTVAYQGYGHGIGLERIAALQDWVVGALRPDLTLILDLPAAAGLDRAARRSAAVPGAGEDRYESMADEFHRRLRDGFRAIARAEPQRCVLVDAGGDVETVAGAIRAIVATRFGLSLA
jgi:dTMP kinase